MSLAGAGAGAALVCDAAGSEGAGAATETESVAGAECFGLATERPSLSFSLSLSLCSCACACPPVWCACFGEVSLGPGLAGDLFASRGSRGDLRGELLLSAVVGRLPSEPRWPEASECESWPGKW